MYRLFLVLIAFGNIFLFGFIGVVNFILFFNYAFVSLIVWPVGWGIRG